MTLLHDFFTIEHDSGELFRLDQDLGRR
jgi:hypothetical protein